MLGLLQRFFLLLRRAMTPARHLLAILVLQRRDPEVTLAQQEVTLAQQEGAAVEPPLARTSDESSASTNSAVIVTLPAPVSSTGKAYYAFVSPAQRQGKPGFVVAGWSVALQFLGGSWSACGPAPRGFASLEDSINFVLTSCSQTSCAVHTSFHVY